MQFTICSIIPRNTVYRISYLISCNCHQVRKTALREVRILRSLAHENIVTLHEVFRNSGKLYLVFEYVDRTILEVGYDPHYPHQ